MAFRGKKKGSKFDSGGRVGRLETNTRDYYQRISSTLKEGFEDENLKQIFLKNVFTQLCSEAVAVSQNQTVSVILEKLIAESDGDYLVDLLRVFSKDWEIVCHDRFASHVLQSLLMKLAVLGSFDEKHEKNNTAVSLLLDIYTYLVNNIAFNMQATYASHLVRVILEIVGGVTVSDQIIRSKVARQENRTVIATKERKANKKLLKEISAKIFSLKHFADHAMNALSNPVLQTTLLVLQSVLPDLCQDICKQIKDDLNIFASVDNNAGLPQILCHPIGSRFIEQVLAVANDDLFQEIFSTQFAGNLAKISTHPVANFILQKLIKRCSSEEILATIVEELMPNIEDILAHNCAGVVVSLAEGCRRLHIKQRQFVKAILNAFHCDEPMDRQLRCFQVILSWMTYDTLYPESETNDKDSGVEDTKQDDDSSSNKPSLMSISIHGSLLLQQLLRFDITQQPFVKSLLTMSTSELCQICCSPAGNHAIETFVTNTNEQNVDKLLETLKPMLVDVACHKNGSRTLETIWRIASLRQMTTIASILVNHETRLRNNQYGFFIWQNWSLSNYLHRAKDWELAQKGIIKKRKLFTPLFENEATDNESKAESKKRKRQ